MTPLNESNFDIRAAVERLGTFGDVQKGLKSLRIAVDALGRIADAEQTTLYREGSRLAARSSKEPVRTVADDALVEIEKVLSQTRRDR